MIVDTPDAFDASICLDASSNAWMRGRRRIAIRAKTVAQQTQIEVVETMERTLVMLSILAGFVLCIIPGVMALFTHLRHSNRNRQVIAQVSSIVKQAYPDAVLSDDDETYGRGARFFEELS